MSVLYQTLEILRVHRLMLVALIAFFLFSLATPAFCANNQSTNHREQLFTIEHQQALIAINAVKETFRLSIINKDKDSFINLFYAEDIPWLGFFSDASFQFTQQKHAKIHKVAKDTYSNFINGLVSAPQAVEEKFWHIVIQTDQNIASVHFHYRFHLAEYKSNWGQEALESVEAEQGWKINSVIWTMVANQQSPNLAINKPSNKLSALFSFCKANSNFETLSCV